MGEPGYRAPRSAGAGMARIKLPPDAPIRAAPRRVNALAVAPPRPSECELRLERLRALGEHREIGDAVAVNIALDQPIRTQR